MSDRITVEQLVRIRIPRHELLLELTPEEVDQLAKALHFDIELTTKIARALVASNAEIANLKGEVSMLRKRLAALVSIPVPPPTNEGLDRLAADLGMTVPVNETGPTLQDDIESMIANHNSDPTADLFDDIHGWQLEAFPNADARSKFEHLKREIAELGEDITKASEIADCMLLLIGMAKIQGINPIQAMRDKLAVNKARKWGKPDALGVVEHVRDVDTSAKHVDGTSENSDDADEQEAEFLSRLPNSPHKDNDSTHKGEDSTHNASEPVTNTFGETFEQWVQRRYAELLDKPKPLNKIQIDLYKSVWGKKSIAEIRAALGPATEKPEILTETPPATPEPPVVKDSLTTPLIDRFPEPLVGLDINDNLALAFELLEVNTGDISVFYTNRAGIDECMAHRAQIRALKPEYDALPPYQRREFKEQLQAKWRDCVKGAV